MSALTTSILTRAATKADLPAVLAIYGQPAFNDGAVLALDQAEAWYDRLSDYADYQLYVAEENGVVCGTFCLLVMENLARRGARSAVIEAVAVAPQAQGRGVGRVMIREALDAARTKHCYKATLSSNLKAEPAHLFYEGLGFERHGYSFRMPLTQAGWEASHV